MFPESFDALLDTSKDKKMRAGSLIQAQEIINDENLRPELKEGAACEASVETCSSIGASCLKISNIANSPQLSLSKGPVDKKLLALISKDETMSAL